MKWRYHRRFNHLFARVATVTICVYTNVMHAVCKRGIYFRLSRQNIFRFGAVELTLTRMNTRNLSSGRFSTGLREMKCVLQAKRSLLRISFFSQSEISPRRSFQSIAAVSCNGE